MRLHDWRNAAAFDRMAVSGDKRWVMTPSRRQLVVEWRARAPRLLAVVAWDAPELKAGLGVTWQRASHRAEAFDYAVIENSAGHVFALRRFVGMPVPGTEVVVDLDLARPECALDEALSTLGLSRDDVIWSPSP
jgi:hypothetical protein